MRFEPEFVERRKAWTDRLRLNDLPQTTAVLHRPEASSQGREGYCCLGVAVLIAQSGGLEIKTKISEYSDCEVIWGTSGPRGLEWISNVLSDEILTWYGFEGHEDVQGMYLKGEGSNTPHADAWSLNDSSRYTFPEIAEALEAYWHTQTDDNA